MEKGVGRLEIEDKKKALTIRRHASGTGCGPSSSVTLTALETRVLGIIGALAVEGHSEIEEQGFNGPSTASAQNLPDDLSIGDEDGILSIPPPSQSPQAVLSQEPVHIVSLSSTSRQQQPTASSARRSPSRPAIPSAPTTPPPSTSRPPQTAPSPHSSFGTPQSRHQRARRRRALTPFDRAVSEFVSVEHRRLRIEEMRERNEARRIEVEHERNNLLSRFADIAQAMLHHLSRDSDVTIQLDT